MASRAQQTFALTVEALKTMLGLRRVQPRTPAILQGVRARGGWWNGGCPVPDEMASAVAAGLEEAHSPELTERLASCFPTGSDASRLESALQEEGFKLIAPCENDPTIHRAVFRQTGGGFFGPYPIDATVAWKVSDTQQIVWTKGHVWFIAP